MKYANLFLVNLLLASMSTKVFAHYDPLSPALHTHGSGNDVQVVMMVVGIICAVVVLPVLVRRALAMFRKRK